MGLSGDDITRLYGEHARGLLRFFARRTADPESAVDLVSETFAVALKSRAKFRGETEDEAVGWLYGIARNLLHTYHRRGVVERKAMQRLGGERRDLRPEEFERIEELAGLDDLRERVARALEELPADQQEAVRLRVLEELDYPEVAARAGTSVPNVRARVSRGLRALHQNVAFAGEEA